MKKLREKTVERRLSDAVKLRGGLCIKLWGFSFAGLPDRLILLPGGIVFFRELKSWGKVPSKLQLSRIALLTRLGFNTKAILNENDYLETLKEMDYALYT